jgi:hypothetical protein
MTAVFLVSTVATSVTGFMFHFAAFGPPEIIGVISLIGFIALAVAAAKKFHPPAPAAAFA